MNLNKRYYLFTIFFLVSLWGFVFSQEQTANLTAVSSSAIVEIGKDEKVSLDLRGVDIVELLKIISLKTGLTIASSKDIQGRANLFLRNVRLNDALDIICATQGLAYDKKGNIVTFMTAAEYLKLYGRDFNEKKAFKSIKLNYANPVEVTAILDQLKSSVGKIILDAASGTLLLLDTPEKLVLMEQVAQNLDQSLTTVVFDLHYADPAYIKTVLEDVVTPKLGKVIVDERSDKVIFTDLPDRVKKATDIVASLDEETRQVLVEGKIVQVELSDENTRGIEWETIIREQENISNFKGVFPATLTQYGRLNVGTLVDNDFNAILNFLENFGKTTVISSPSVIAVNNQEAKFMVGTREAFVSQTLSQAETTTVTSESIQFIDVGVKMKIKAAIGSDDFITLQVKPEISSVSKTITTTAGSVIPIVATSEAETTVKVKNGMTAMIAGLRRVSDISSSNGVPIIDRAPILRRLFGGHTQTKKTTELIIFLTPKLVRGDVSMGALEKTPHESDKLEIVSDNVKMTTKNAGNNNVLIGETKLKRIEQNNKDKISTSPSVIGRSDLKGFKNVGQ